MSTASQIAAYLFASGDAFFVGAALIVLGRAATSRCRRNRGARWLRLVTISGVILFLLSVTPLPLWSYALCVLPVLLCLNLPLQSDEGKRWTRILSRAQPLVEIVLLMTVGAEVLERRRLHVQPLERLPLEVHVIGDSLSAGIANEKERLWTNIVASHWNIAVHNHAQPGATTASAWRQAEEIECSDCLVLIEIGGNDLLSGRDSWQIEADLDRLLARLGAPHRTLVMFELPVPPILGGYEFARLQRRLAHRHTVRLIPRREFAKVLLTPGATTDGLHLSIDGHHAIADLVLQLLTPTAN